MNVQIHSGAPFRGYSQHAPNEHLPLPIACEALGVTAGIGIWGKAGHPLLDPTSKAIMQLLAGAAGAAPDSGEI